MDAQYFSDSRISIHPETKLKGKKNIYIVQNIISISNRSVTMHCRTEDGTQWRLKFFNGEHSVTQSILETLMQYPMKGVVLPIDSGEFSGQPFCIFPSKNAIDTEKFPIAQQLLIKKIIPQLSYVIHQYHQKRILLRDICPEHILYQVKEEQIAYCGFQNAVVLPEKVTLIKQKGYGQHDSFLAPEVEKYGYSIYSDYFSLGMTLLCLVKGKNPFAGMEKKERDEKLNRGIVLGIDIAHLRNTPYECYSEEDKILYLILGLILPNPRQRWGYGELRCWCNGQHIPLVRKNGRIVYQYNAPFLIGTIQCWNYRQLTQTMVAKKDAWTESALQRLLQFAKEQNIPYYEKIEEWQKTEEYNTYGKIFRCIYAMNPALDGLWWTGKKYLNIDTLVQEAACNPMESSILHDILRNRCLSFFLQMRTRVNAVNPKDISEAEQMEQWEREELGKGVNRCIMRYSLYSKNRGFLVEGKIYDGLEELLKNYQKNPLRLKVISCDIISNKSFQAWLWANGLEEAGTKAKELCNTEPKQSFYILLKIAESQLKSEGSKKVWRDIYMRYGDYAPIYWLKNHIMEYKAVSITDHILMDVWKEADFSLELSLETLTYKAKRMIPDYQHFVIRTAKNALEVQKKNLNYVTYSFYPVLEDGFFNCIWENGLEVCPAFLKSISHTIT